MDYLSKKLRSRKIKYRHIKGIGGLRHSKKDSINLGWQNKSFRGFADYMQTDEFKDNLEKLINLSKKNILAIMCAESLPWRCHRFLISDALVIKKIKVKHIMNLNKMINHKINPLAQIKDSEFFYPKKIAFYL